MTVATTTCPSCGASSATADYCDSCGASLAAIAAMPVGAQVAGAPAVQTCPNCDAARSAEDTFCESCGLDFATGQMPVETPAPAPSAAAPSGWTAVVTADQLFFDTNQVLDRSGARPAFPAGLSPREVPLSGDEVVIGRRSEAKGFFPAVDLSEGAADPGVSRRHAVLRRQADGTWALIDEMSTNGTFLNGADKPLDNGVAIAVHDGDFVCLGAFTRISFRNDAAAP